MYSTSEAIALIQKQFLYSVPLKKIDWHGIFTNMDDSLQLELLKNTVDSDLILKYPMRARYQLSFLKYLLKELEKTGCGIIDEVYESVCRLCLEKTPDICYVHYKIGNTGHTISLKENCCIISKGTTGLYTWQAALALSEWIVQNASKFTSKTILELGSGLGLVGLILYKFCNPDNVYLSDCNMDVLATLVENVKFNLQETTDERFDCDHVLALKERCLYSSLNVSDSKMHILKLPWNHITKDVCQDLGKIDMVIASDIVFEQFTGPLVDALSNLTEHCKVNEFIFACTLRNPEATFNPFRRLLGDSFTIEDLTLPMQEKLVWPSDYDFYMMHLRKIKEV